MISRKARIVLRSPHTKRRILNSIFRMGMTYSQHLDDFYANFIQTHTEYIQDSLKHHFGLTDIGTNTEETKPDHSPSRSVYPNYFIDEKGEVHSGDYNGPGRTMTYIPSSYQD